ncbi:hypothetical protein C1I98_28550 [Spongiactinospora gelatinilytica]|uniref:Uncharacterized protein n=1 Tax=Spongiactinospora gelatinilytica TaxID=2666298 RepID=A0A2W2FDX8_9ACTN|nr:hypothetical protein [Spongiactinospora gelatinilytica]PZG33711.1 hypothetical protein C1I98_28550 [Spongiactinospora gelatinilytica]
MTDQRSPLAQADDAKQRRDLYGEVAAIKAGYEVLTSAPWYPARVGDILHVHYEAAGDVAAWGETYIVSDASDGLELHLLAHTAEDDDAVGAYSPGMPDDPIMEAWMEAGPGTLTVVRDGRVIHPARES